MRVFGLILGITVVIILGIAITLIDRKISTKKNEISDLTDKREVRLSQNWSEYLSYTSKEKIIRLTQIISQYSNRPKKEIDAIHSEYLEARRDALIKLHIMLKGNIPRKEQLDSWEKMSMVQLLEEDKKIQREENLTRLLAEIKLKEKELNNLEALKSKVVIIATILQVCSLFLLEFSRKAVN